MRRILELTSASLLGLALLISGVAILLGPSAEAAWCNNNVCAQPQADPESPIGISCPLPLVCRLGCGCQLFYDVYEADWFCTCQPLPKDPNDP